MEKTAKNASIFKYLLNYLVGKPHYDLPCKTTYPSQYVKLPTFSIYFEKVGGFTVLSYGKWPTIHKFLKITYFITICITTTLYFSRISSWHWKYDHKSNSNEDIHLVQIEPKIRSLDPLTDCLFVLMWTGLAWAIFSKLGTHFKLKIFFNF